jgi:hypothetical protein
MLKNIFLGVKGLVFGDLGIGEIKCKYTTIVNILLTAFKILNRLICNIIPFIIKQFIRLYILPFL